LRVKKYANAKTVSADRDNSDIGIYKRSQWRLGGK